MLKTHMYEIDWLFNFDTIDDLIAKLYEVKEKHKDAHTVYIDCEWTGYEDVEYQVCYELEETEEEKQTRLSIERTEREVRRRYEEDQQRKKEWRELVEKKEKELSDLKERMF